MKHILSQIFQSGRFRIGFGIFATIVLTVLIYPLVIKDRPLTIISRGTFLAPGIYVNVYDSIAFTPRYTLVVDDAAARRVAAKLSDEDRQAMFKWLVAADIPAEEINVDDTAKLLQQWESNFDPTKRLPGMTNADRNYYIRLSTSLEGVLATEGEIIAANDANTGQLAQKDLINQTDYVNVNEVPNSRLFVLGTDNFGRDILTELVSATGVSLTIGFVAGTVATIIGLLLGLISGYVGGFADELIVFITNLFTVIPSFVLLILISFSIGQDKRGAITIAVVIGLTSWV
ncbi:MAG: hypothetical protein U0521_25680 [Anaerolineae bacterium]